MAKRFEPQLKTAPDFHSKVELAKRQSNGLERGLAEDFRSSQDDIPWDTEQVAKSYGIYLEYNRATTGHEKDWMYMIRVGVPGGGPISPAQWRLLDDLSEQHSLNPDAQSSLRLTTRENIQFHWVKKDSVIPIIQALAESGILSLNGCGDNVRSVMACPLAAHSGVFDGKVWAAKIARYFQLPTGPYAKIFAIDPDALDSPTESFKYGPQILNRKFKMGILGVHRNPESGQLEYDNCVEVRTHDVGIVPLIAGDSVQDFQLFLGGGQGEKFGKPSASMLSEPFAVVKDEQMIDVLDAIVSVQQEWGDRKNRHWARLKYIIRKQGMPWFRSQVEAKIGDSLEDPVANLDVGARQLHHGWTRQGSSNKFSYGLFVENGRITDHSPNGRLKSLVRDLSAEFQSPLQATPNQDLVFTNIPEARIIDFEQRLLEYGYGQRFGRPYSKLRMESGACVGKDTCRVSYTDSEKFEPFLIDELERRGWGNLATSIGVTGCERQCFRPATKAIGIIGSGIDQYLIKLLGTEDGRHQGVPVTVDEQSYLSAVKREDVAVLLDALFRFHEIFSGAGESLGYFHRRIGLEGIVQALRYDKEAGRILEQSSERVMLAV